jgi:hypothetical protein
MSGDLGDGSAEDPAADVDEEDLVAKADERIEDAEDEFGPDAPPRGATPGNPQAEENPS